MGTSQRDTLLGFTIISFGQLILPVDLLGELPGFADFFLLLLKFGFMLRDQLQHFSVMVLHQLLLLG